MAPFDSGMLASATLTVVVPAYNEAASIADTIRSLKSQSLQPHRILVIDDCSQDDTAAIALAAGAEVVRPPANTGSKAGAQTFGLQFVTSELIMAIDADTVLASDGVEKMMTAMRDPDLAAACGFVIPRFAETIWERGRYVEYLITLGFYKSIQDFYGRPLIASGCFSIYRTEILRAMGGWSTRTLAEDMDLTWSLYRAGRKVRFVKDATSFPIEPHDFAFLGKQLRRWSHGFMQNVRLHLPAILHDRTLSLLVTVALFDSILAPLMYLCILPLAALFFSPWYLSAYVFDLPILALPILAEALERGEVAKALASLPAFLILRQVNAAYMLAAGWKELVLRQSFHIYEKGH
jgi:biofilm PGA synthesis N-glycosyltransferase PgaC